MTQVDTNPPTFVCFINSLDKQNFAFAKWVENTLRRGFGFIWVPLSITFKEKSDREDRDDRDDRDER